MTFVLFAGFVVLLFVGYLGVYASVPSTGLAALFLFGSLGVLAFANLSADRRLQELTPSASA